MLTERQHEIASLVATGASNKEIARQLYLRPSTVRNMLTYIFAKTGARCRTDLAIQIVSGDPRAQVRTRALPD